MLIDFKTAVDTAWKFIKENFEDDSHYVDEDFKTILKQDMEQKIIVFQKCPNSLSLAVTVEGINVGEIAKALQFGKLDEWCQSKREDVYHDIVKMVEDTYALCMRESHGTGKD